MADFLKGVGDALSAVNPALGVASNIIGGLFGAGNQRSANETNLEIARMNAQAQRETNAMNERLFHESNVFSEKMWNKSNEYNSPSAQVQRLVNAGINPAFVMGNGSTAEASALQSAAAPHMDAPVMNASVQPFDPSPYVHGAFTAANAFTQNQLQNAQAENIISATQGQNIQNQLDAMQVRAKILALDLDNESKKRYLDLFDKTMDAQVALANGNVAHLNASTRQIEQSILSQQLHDSIDQQIATSQLKLNNKQLSVLNATIGQISAQIGLLRQQTKTEQEKTINQIIQNGLSALSLDQQKELIPIVVESARTSLEKLQFETWEQQFAPAAPGFNWQMVPKHYLNK